MVCGYVAIIPIAHPNAQILAASDERDTERKNMRKPILTLSLSLLMLASCALKPTPSPSKESETESETSASVESTTLEESTVSEESTPDSETSPDEDVTNVPTTEPPAPEKEEYGYSARYTDLDGYSEKVQTMMKMTSHVLKAEAKEANPKQRRNAIVANSENVLGFDINSFETVKLDERPASDGEFIVASNIFHLQRKILSVADIVDANQYVMDELSGIYTGFYLNGDEMALYDFTKGEDGVFSNISFFYVQENENGVFYYALMAFDSMKLVNIAVPGQYLYVGTSSSQMYLDCSEKFIQNERHYVSTYQIQNGNPAESIDAIQQYTENRCTEIIASQTKSEVTLAEFLERTSSPYTSDLIDSTSVYYVTAAYQDPITTVVDISEGFSDFGLDFEDSWTLGRPIARELYRIGNDERDEILHTSSFKTLKPLETAEDYIQNAMIQVSPEITLTFTNYRVDPSLCLDYMGYMTYVDQLINACEVTEANRTILLDLCRYFARPYDDIKANPKTDLGTRIDALTLAEDCTNGDELKSTVKDFLAYIIAGTPQS